MTAVRYAKRLDERKPVATHANFGEIRLLSISSGRRLGGKDQHIAIGIADPRLTGAPRLISRRQLHDGASRGNLGMQEIHVGNP